MFSIHLHVMQDDDMAVFAMHASPSGWRAPDWLTKLGSNPPQSKVAPQTLPTSSEVASGAGATTNHGDKPMESTSGTSTSDEDDAGGRRMVDVQTAGMLREVSEEDAGLPPDVREVAFQQLDEALLSNWQKQTILKVWSHIPRLA